MSRDRGSSMRDVRGSRTRGDRARQFYLNQGLPTVVMGRKRSRLNEGTLADARVHRNVRPLKSM